MKLTRKLLAGASALVVTSATGIGLASALTPTPPAVPAEQQALVTAGYAKVADWGKFVKVQNGCTTTVMLSGTNYYVSTKGKLSSTLYPVRPNHVVAGADLLAANCQG